MNRYKSEIIFLVSVFIWFVMAVISGLLFQRINFNEFKPILVCLLNLSWFAFILITAFFIPPLLEKLLRKIFG